MTKPQHTLTPEISVQKDGNYWIVFSTTRAPEFFQTNAEAIAFARGLDIGQAINSDLLEACKAMVSAMWQHFEYHHDGDDDCGFENCQLAIDIARTALTKAQGGAK